MGCLLPGWNFLPIGADVNTAVFRVISEGGAIYFLKLRKGDFDPLTVTIPQYLQSRGNQAIIAPLETKARQSWVRLDEYALILYPYIEGKNGYQVKLSDAQWLDFGTALKAVHSTHLPAALADRLPRETFSPRYREMVRVFMAQAERERFTEPVANKTAAVMRARRAEIGQMVERADQLGRLLQNRSLEMVLCHADIHAGNLLIAADQALYIVDWDNPVFAPRERDLQLIGGCSTWNSPREEEWFYQGYGLAALDRAALAYYRYERIIQDIAAYGEQLLLSEAGGDDREQSFGYFSSQFFPGHEVEIAIRTDHALNQS